MQLPLCMV